MRKLNERAIREYSQDDSYEEGQRSFSIHTHSRPYRKSNEISKETMKRLIEEIRSEEQMKNEKLTQEVSDIK